MEMETSRRLGALLRSASGPKRFTTHYILCLRHVHKCARIILVASNQTPQLARITPRVPANLKRDLMAFCKREGMTLEGAVTKLLRKALAS